MSHEINQVIHVTKELTSALDRETQSALAYDLEGMASCRDEKESLVQRFEEAVAAIEHQGMPDDSLASSEEVSHQDPALHPVRQVIMTLQAKAKENEQVLARLSTAQQDFIDMIVDVARARTSVTGAYGPQGTLVRSDVGVSLRQNQTF